MEKTWSGEYSALVVQAQSGERDVIELSRLGGKVRFSLGEPGMRSSVWTVSATPAGEVYVFERSLARDVKFSLHRSGDWRYAWNQGMAGLSASGQNWVNASQRTRIIDRWRRPEPMYERFTFGVGIRVAASELRPVPHDDASEESVAFVEAPPAGTVGLFTVLLCKPGSTGFNLTDSVVIDAFPLRTGEVVLIAATICEPSIGELDLLDQVRAEARKRRPPTAGVSDRAFLHLPRPDGGRNVWEVAVD